MNKKKKQGGGKEERKRRAGRTRGNGSLKAHEVTPDHPEKECTTLEILKLEEALKSGVIYTLCPPFYLNT